jgi:hypothetical protein
MRAHSSGRVTSFMTMREMQCAGVRSNILQGTMGGMQCVQSSSKTYPCQKAVPLRAKQAQTAHNGITLPLLKTEARTGVVGQRHVSAA